MGNVFPEINKKAALTVHAMNGDRDRRHEAGMDDSISSHPSLI
jgi:hypothetical protein